MDINKAGMAIIPTYIIMISMLNIVHRKGNKLLRKKQNKRRRCV